MTDHQRRSSDRINTWEETLDAMESSLAHYEATLAGDTVEPDPYWSQINPPNTPMPRDLTERAAAIMARSNRLTDAIQAKLDARPRPSSRRPGYNRPSSSVSRFDTEA